MDLGKQVREISECSLLTWTWQGKTMYRHLHTLQLVHFLYAPSSTGSLHSSRELGTTSLAASSSFTLYGKSLLSWNLPPDLLFLFRVFSLFFHIFYCYRILVPGFFLMLFPLCAFPILMSPGLDWHSPFFCQNHHLALSMLCWGIPKAGEETFLKQEPVKKKWRYE